MGWPIGKSTWNRLLQVTEYRKGHGFPWPASLYACSCGVAGQLRTRVGQPGRSWAPGGAGSRRSILAVDLIVN